MDVAVGDEPARIAGLDWPEPQWCMRGLRRQHVGNVRALDVLVVQGAGVEDRIFAGCRGTIDIDGELRAVAHRHHDIAFLNEHDRIAHRFLPVGLSNTRALAGIFSNCTTVKYNGLRRMAILNLTAVKINAISHVRRSRAQARADSIDGRNPWKCSIPTGWWWEPDLPD